MLYTQKTLITVLFLQVRSNFVRIYVLYFSGTPLSQVVYISRFFGNIKKAVECRIVFAEKILNKNKSGTDKLSTSSIYPQYPKKWRSSPDPDWKIFCQPYHREAQSGPPWHPPFWRRRDAGDRIDQNLKSIVGIAWIHGNPLPRPLWSLSSSPMTYSMHLPPWQRRYCGWEEDISCTAPRCPWLVVEVPDPLPCR